MDAEYANLQKSGICNRYVMYVGYFRLNSKAALHTVGYNRPRTQNGNLPEWAIYIL
jgi:hypothetical protein